MNLFEYQDFKRFIVDKIKENHAIRGYRSRLSEAAGIQRSFLSHVLHSQVLLGPDHALKLCEFWNFTPDETEYFVTLVHLSRAQTINLKHYYERRLNELKRRTEDLSHRLGRTKHQIREKGENSYYGFWYYSAIHIATSIPKLRTTQAIAEKLRLDPKLVQSVLMDLQTFGLVKKNKDYWEITENHLHLPKDSPFIVSHHSHWRQKVISRLQQSDISGLHYSVIFGISREDKERLRQLLLELVDKTKRIVEPSPEEELVCFLMDFFDV